MIDVKILAIKDILTVNDVRIVPGFLPPTLEITGVKLLQADEVTINDIPAPEFALVSNTKLLAQIPNSQTRTNIRRVTVLATLPSPDRRSFLRFEVGRTFSKIAGLEKLVQLFVKLLLQTPGSDSFAPQLGGGLMTAIGRTVSRRGKTALSGLVVSSVNRTRDQVMSMQSRDSRIPPDEKLLRVDTLAVGFNPNTTTLAARIAIGALSGREAVANLTF